jgi:hypothetical protein
MAIDEHRVGQWPEMFCRLEFWGIRRQKQEVHMFRNSEAHTGMPPRSVEHQHNLFGRTGSHHSGKGRELRLKKRYGDTGGEVKDRATGSGVDKADDIPPGETVPHNGGWPLANGRPDSPQKWLQADTMFIHGPQLNLSMGKGRGHRS